VNSCVPNSRRSIIASVIAVAAFAGTTAIAAPASAQQYIPTATFQPSSGMQGGGGKDLTLERAPTRFRIGADLHVDEDPRNGLGFAGLIDLEPRARFGADIRYIHLVGESFALSGGAVGYITPGSAIGPVAAMEYRQKMNKEMWITAGPEIDVFVVGIDIPDKTVIWQALLHVGLRVDL
jgi:hypothetical protein